MFVVVNWPIERCFPNNYEIQSVQGFPHLSGNKESAPYSIVPVGEEKSTCLSVCTPTLLLTPDGNMFFAQLRMNISVIESLAQLLLSSLKVIKKSVQWTPRNPHRNNKRRRDQSKTRQASHLAESV